MTNTIIEMPIPYIGDFNKGRPLFNAQIFVGEPDLDPEIVANQKQIVGIQEDGTEVNLSQPVLTGSGGYPTFNGSPIRLATEGAYSLKILDKDDNQEYFFDNVFDGAPITFDDQPVLSVETVTDLRAFEPDFDLQVIYLVGHTTSGIGGGSFYTDANDVASADNNGTVIVTAGGARWKRQLSDSIDFTMFGCLDDAISTTNLQAALDVCSTDGLSIRDYTSNTYQFIEGATSGFGLVIGTGSNIAGNFTLKQADGGYSITAAVRVAPSAVDVVLKDFKLDFNRDNVTGTVGNGLVGSDDNDNIKYDGLTLSNATNRSLVTNNDAIVGVAIPQPNSANNVSVVNCSVLNAGDKGFMVRKTQNSSVSDCYNEGNITDAGNASGSCFESSQSYKIDFTNCNSVHTGTLGLGPGIRTVNGSQYIKYTNCTVEDGRQGFFIADVSHIKYIGCTSIRAAFEGALINSAGSNDPSYALMKNIMVKDCDIINCGQDTANAGIITNIGIATGELNGISLQGNFIFSDDGNMTQGIWNKGDTINDTALNTINEFSNEIQGNTGGRLLGDFVGIRNAQFDITYNNTVILDDDEAIAIPAPLDYNNAIMDLITRDSVGRTLSITYRIAGTAEVAEIFNGNGAVMATTTGILTGTTGADGFITLSPNNDGNIYLENRVGSSQRFFFSFRT